MLIECGKAACREQDWDRCEALLCPRPQPDVVKKNDDLQYQPQPAAVLAAPAIPVLPPLLPGPPLPPQPPGVPIQALSKRRGQSVSGLPPSTTKSSSWVLPLSPSLLQPCDMSFRTQPSLGSPAAAAPPDSTPDAKQYEPHSPAAGNQLLHPAAATLPLPPAAFAGSSPPAAPAPAAGGIYRPAAPTAAAAAAPSELLPWQTSLSNTAQCSPPPHPAAATAWPVQHVHPQQQQQQQQQHSMLPTPPTAAAAPNGHTARPPAAACSNPALLPSPTPGGPTAAPMQPAAVAAEQPHLGVRAHPPIAFSLEPPFPQAQQQPAGSGAAAAAAAAGEELALRLQQVQLPREPLQLPRATGGGSSSFLHGVPAPCQPPPYHHQQQQQQQQQVAAGGGTGSAAEPAAPAGFWGRPLATVVYHSSPAGQVAGNQQQGQDAPNVQPQQPQPQPQPQHLHTQLHQTTPQTLLPHPQLQQLQPHPQPEQPHLPQQGQGATPVAAHRWGALQQPPPPQLQQPGAGAPPAVQPPPQHHQQPPPAAAAWQPPPQHHQQPAAAWQPSTPPHPQQSLPAQQPSTPPLQQQQQHLPPRVPSEGRASGSGQLGWSPGTPPASEAAAAATAVPPAAGGSAGIPGGQRQSSTGGSSTAVVGSQRQSSTGGDAPLAGSWGSPWQGPAGVSNTGSTGITGSTSSAGHTAGGSHTGLAGMGGGVSSGGGNSGGFAPTLTVAHLGPPSQQQQQQQHPQPLHQQQLQQQMSGGGSIPLHTSQEQQQQQHLYASPVAGPPAVAGHVPAAAAAALAPQRDAQLVGLQHHSPQAIQPHQQLQPHLQQQQLLPHPVQQQQQVSGSSGPLPPPAHLPAAAAVAAGGGGGVPAAIPATNGLPEAAAARLAAQQLLVPFSELRFGRQVGEGGFGKVYCGQVARWHGKQVAIKLLSSQAPYEALEKLRQQFLREVTTMSSLPEHPHVLKLLGVVAEGPHLALVTEYCSLGSLYGLLHTPGYYLSWLEVMQLLLGAARGMRHLHRHQVLHRDLKSGNLLVDAAGCVKVADFGLSRLQPGMEALTGGLGTYQWMAPEVLANQHYSHRADVYSFGIVAWECCARRLPYTGMNGVQAALAVMSKGLRPEVPAHAPPQLAALIKACWAAVPEQRPGWQQVVEQLQAMVAEEEARAAATVHAAPQLQQQ